MTRRPARAADDGADFAWPPADEELDRFVDEPPTRPRTTVPRLQVDPPSAPSPPAALPDGRPELEWPPSPESLSSMSIVSVQTGRELSLDPDTGTLMARPAASSARPRDHAARPRPVAIPPNTPVPAAAAGRPLPTVAIGLALAGLLALTAPPALDLWRIADGQGPLLPPLPPAPTPRVAAPPPPLPAGLLDAGTDAIGIAAASAPPAISPPEAAAPPAAGERRGDGDPTAGLTAIPTGELLPLPAPPPRP